jgi:hypothetical protein
MHRLSIKHDDVRAVDQFDLEGDGDVYEDVLQGSQLCVVLLHRQSPIAAVFG